MAADINFNLKKGVRPILNLDVADGENKYYPS
jgi:hypothetical protein